jgi:hypothetical protein
MQFINKEGFQDSFYKDIIRINYDSITKNQLINDFGYSYLMLKYGEIKTRDHNGQSVEIPEVFIKTSGDFFYVDAYPESSWITFELPATFFHKVTSLNASQNINKLVNLSEFVDRALIEKLHNLLEDCNAVD